MIVIVGLPILLASLECNRPADASRVRAPFCVVDAADRPLLSVEGFHNGAARLALFNRGKRLRTVLLATEKGGNLWVLDRTGKASASLMSDEGGGHLQLLDREGKRSTQ
jgi:hypothetical protein